jgi:hypothetical protein
MIGNGAPTFSSGASTMVTPSAPGFVERALMRAILHFLGYWGDVRPGLTLRIVLVGEAQSSICVVQSSFASLVPY